MPAFESRQRGARGVLSFLSRAAPGFESREVPVGVTAGVIVRPARIWLHRTAVGDLPEFFVLCFIEKKPGLIDEFHAVPLLPVMTCSDGDAAFDCRMRFGGKLHSRRRHHRKREHIAARFR